MAFKPRLEHVHPHAVVIVDIPRSNTPRQGVLPVLANRIGAPVRIVGVLSRCPCQLGEQQARPLQQPSTGDRIAHNSRSMRIIRRVPITIGGSLRATKPCCA